MSIKTKLLLYATSILSIAFLTALVCATMNLVRAEGFSRDFLQQMHCVPPSTRQTMVVVVLLTLSMIVMDILLEGVTDKEKHKAPLYAVLLWELLACLALNYYLCCTFRNAIYFMVANIITYPLSPRKRFVFLAAALLCYIGIDYNQVASYFVPYNFAVLENYLHNGNASNWLGIKSVLLTLNDVSCIMLCLTVISATNGEKQNIEALNNKLRRTVDELHVSNVQLKQQAKRDEDFAIYKERLRFSREMHDSIGYVLTGVVVGLNACDALMEDHEGKLSQQIKRLSTLAANGLNELRTAINDMRIGGKDNRSLTDDIRELLSDISACVSMEIASDIDVNERVCLSGMEENVVYRIVQESVTNAVRHARAKHMWISVGVAHTGIRVSVQNDGHVQAPITEGFGLSNMRERVSGLGGRMTVEITTDGLFSLCIEISATRGAI
ncbi:MAG: histidine kinase [Clostridia bacterium]